MFTTRRRPAAVAAAALTLAGTLALTACSGSGGASAEVEPYDPDQEVTIDVTWWGNDDRATKYEQAIALFNDEYPNITVATTFTDYPAYWDKRKTEAAGGGLPDVMQFDYTYVREFGESGLLADLGQFYGDEIDTEGIDDAVLDSGKIDDAYYAVPTGTNAWALFENQTLTASSGAEAYAGGGDWTDYDDYLTSVKDATGGSVYGGTDYTGRIQFFELWMRQQGKDLFTEDGEVNFTEDELGEFLELGQGLRDDDEVVPASKVEEIKPVSPFGAGLATSEFSWDNFGAGYQGDLGTDAELSLAAPPTLDDSVKDLYLKPALMFASSAKSDQPAASAIFIDFMLNTPEVGGVFGASLGIPASESAREGADLAGLDAQVAEYEQTIADRIGEAPPVPVIGYGSLEQSWLDLGASLGLGAITADEFVKQFFDEISVVVE